MPKARHSELRISVPIGYYIWHHAIGSALLPTGGFRK